jgi:hypothetical protein
VDEAATNVEAVDEAATDVEAADEAATDVEAAGLGEIVATVTLRLEVVGQSLVILFTEHNDACIIDREASTFRRELNEARALVSLQYDKKASSDWITSPTSTVSEFVTWLERQSSHFNKAMLKLPFGKHIAGFLPVSSAKMRAWSVPDIYWLASLADCKQWLLGVIHLPHPA